MQDHSAAILNLLSLVTQRGTEQAGEALQAKLRGKLLGPRRGRTYTASGKPSPHIASAPGEAPAHWTGQLADAVSVRQARDAGGRFSGGWEVYVDPEKAPYAANYLEYGSPGGKIAPRPWFWPTVEEFEGEFAAIMTAAVKEALR